MYGTVPVPYNTYPLSNRKCSEKYSVTIWSTVVCFSKNQLNTKSLRYY